MADPVAPYGRITGRWTDATGQPARGSVTVTVTRPPQTVETTAGRAVVVQATTVPMDTHGAVSIDVLTPAPTDPQAATWTYSVTVRIPGVYHQTRTVPVSQATVTDLTVVPLPEYPDLDALAAGLTQLRAVVAELTARIVALEAGTQPPTPNPPSPSGATAILHRDGSLTIGATRE